MKQDIEEIKRVIIIASAASQVLHEALDDLEGTSYYRQSLKMATKRLQAELTKTCDDQTNGLFKADDKSMMAIQDGIIELSHQIVGADLIKLAAIGDLLKANPNALEEV